MRPAAVDEMSEEVGREEGQVAGEQEHGRGRCAECGVQAAQRPESGAAVGKDGQPEMGIGGGIADDDAREAEGMCRAEDALNQGLAAQWQEGLVAAHASALAAGEHGDVDQTEPIIPAIGWGGG